MFETAIRLYGYFAQSLCHMQHVKKETDPHQHPIAQSHRQVQERDAYAVYDGIFLGDYLSPVVVDAYLYPLNPEQGQGLPRPNRLLKEKQD